MNVLVTGGAGFVGCNVADRLAAEGHDVVVFDSLVRDGTEDNLNWLTGRHPRRVLPVIADIRDETAVGRAVAEADAIFHFAGQVAVTTSLADPALDFATNLRGTFNLLEAARRARPHPALLFASTNKVYGALDDVSVAISGDRYVPDDPQLASFGVSESRALSFRTPYGCSKGAADQYVLDYATSFGLPACVLRMSCIYGARQIGTEDQGWLAHFARSAIDDAPITIYGDGRQVRDVLDVRDAVSAYLAAWKKIRALSGKAINLGGGPNNAISLRQAVAALENAAGNPIDCTYAAWRAGDQRWYVSDTRAATDLLGLEAPIGWREGISDLVAWMKDERRTAPRAHAPLSEVRP